MHLDISCSTDNNYLQHCMAMLCSVFENNTAHDITVHLLHNNLAEQSQRLVADLCSRYDQHIKLYDLSNSDLLSNLTITHPGLSIATYYRLILESLVDKSISRLLYLDCDVIVLDDISPLFEMNIGDKGVAAVKDSCPYDNAHRFLIGKGVNEIMFCAGVLLINLEYWRKNHCQKQFFDFISKFGQQLRFEDQDVLNFVFKDNWLQLPYKYGVSPFSIAIVDKAQQVFDYYDYYIRPSIIHFAAHTKPWLNIRVPLDKNYWKYVNLSGFPNPTKSKASQETINKIRITKLRYYISTYIRPFIPNIIETLIGDLFDLLQFIAYLFMSKRLKELRLKRWLKKHHIES